MDSNKMDVDTPGPTTSPRASATQLFLPHLLSPTRASRRIQEQAPTSHNLNSYSNRWSLDSSSQLHNDLKTHAEVWLKVWLLHYNQYGRYKRRKPYKYPSGASHDVVGKSKKQWRDDTHGYFHEALFVNALYYKCPSPKGKINMQIEILLTAAGLEKNPNTLEEVVTLGNWRDDNGLANQVQAFKRLNNFAQILYVRMVIPLSGIGVQNISQECPDIATNKLRDPSVAEHIDIVHRKRDNGVADRANERDGYICQVSGYPSYYCVSADFHDERFVNQSATKRLDRSKTENLHRHSYGALEAAHIIPQKLNSEVKTKDGMLNKEYTWKLLRFYYPGLENELKGNQIDNPENTMMLLRHAHTEFENYHFWFEETSEDHYDVYIDMRRNHMPIHILPGKQQLLPHPRDELGFFDDPKYGANGYLHKISGIKFSSGETDYPTPKKEYLRLHAAFAYSLLLSLGAD